MQALLEKADGPKVEVSVITELEAYINNKPLIKNDKEIQAKLYQLIVNLTTGERYEYVKALPGYDLKYACIELIDIFDNILKININWSLSLFISHAKLCNNILDFWLLKQTKLYKWEVKLQSLPPIPITLLYLKHTHVVLQRTLPAGISAAKNNIEIFETLIVNMCINVETYVLFLYQGMRCYFLNQSNQISIEDFDKTIELIKQKVSDPNDALLISLISTFQLQSNNIDNIITMLNSQDEIILRKVYVGLQELQYLSMEKLRDAPLGINDLVFIVQTLIDTNINDDTNFSCNLINITRGMQLPSGHALQYYNEERFKAIPVVEERSLAVAVQSGPGLTRAVKDWFDDEDEKDKEETEYKSEKELRLFYGLNDEKHISQTSETDSASLITEDGASISVTIKSSAPKESTPTFDHSASSVNADSAQTSYIFGTIAYYFVEFCNMCVNCGHVVGASIWNFFASMLSMSTSVEQSQSLPVTEPVPGDTVVHSADVIENNEEHDKNNEHINPSNEP